MVFCRFLCRVFNGSAAHHRNFFRSCAAILCTWFSSCYADGFLVLLCVIFLFLFSVTLNFRLVFFKHVTGEFSALLYVTCLLALLKNTILPVAFPEHVTTFSREGSCFWRFRLVELQINGFRSRTSDILLTSFQLILASSNAKLDTMGVVRQNTIHMMWCKIKCYLEWGDVWQLIENKKVTFACIKKTTKQKWRAIKPFYTFGDV